MDIARSLINIGEEYLCPLCNFLPLNVTAVENGTLAAIAMLN